VVLFCGAEDWSATRRVSVVLVVTFAPPPSRSLVAGQLTVATTVVFWAAFGADVTGVPVMTCGAG
jgi:hypothetical protein